MVTAITALNPVVLSQLLADSEVTGGAEIVEVLLHRVGDGQVASCWELELVIAGRDDRPRVVAKVPSEDPLSVATAAAQHLYEREVTFYRALADRVSIRSPACYHSSFDGDADFLLLLESMCPVAPTHQLDGLSTVRAALALRELAGLHAPLWGQGEQLAGIGFFGEVAASQRSVHLDVVPLLMGSFLDRYGDMLTSPARDAISWLVARVATYLDGDGSPQTVIHGDYRADNLLFDGRGGEVPLAVVDWQTLGYGSAALDVAYLLTTSLPVASRRAEEHRLLAGYLERLRALGVGDFDADDLWRAYVRHSFQGLVLLTCAAMIVTRTQRGDEMFTTMIERCATAVDDLDARRTLEG